MRTIHKYAQWLLRQRTWLIVFLQGFLVLNAVLAAWLLRFDFVLVNASLLWRAAVVVIVVRLSFLAIFRLMKGWWRYAGLTDVIDIAKAVAAGSVVYIVIVRFVWHSGFPLSICAIESILTWIGISVFRFASRVLAESVREDASCKRLLLVGAGHAAQMIIRETREVETGYVVAGCVDDDPAKHHTKILGVPILGPVSNVPQIVAEQDIDEIVVAVPTASGPTMRRFLEICKQTDIPFKTLPGLAELITGETPWKQVREVRVEDLLGRESVKLDLESVRQHVEDKIAVVTGAAGSIGSELCRQLIGFHPRRLLCIDQNENGIFQLQQELARIQHDVEVQFYVADVRDEERLDHIFANAGCEVVFHAAAYKHVPLMECNLREAIQNNVFGLLSLIAVAQRYEFSDFILISSDKAVNPKNIMGATKRICELLISTWPLPSVRAVSVRFGNVLGSAGSVVPIFQEQLRKGEPITITHPGVTRYFMTISEAVSLVLQAFALGKHRDLLVLDMGNPVSILQLAETLIRLSGRSREKVEIVFTGLRQGEKLFEEMFYESEELLPTPCEKIKRTRAEKTNWPELKARLEFLRQALTSVSDTELLSLVRDIVPEYAADQGAFSEAAAASSAKVVK